MLDRTKAPDIHEIDAVTLQIAEVVNLGNGAKLHLIKSETQPVIRLDFVFKAGKWQEPHKGVSDLAAKMLLEGTLNYTAKQIADKVAFYGASFENNHGYDRTEYTLYCLSKYVDELLPLVLDVLQNPTFPEEEFDLLKQRTIQNLKVQRQKNSYLATHGFTKLIYGAEHPYTYGFDEHDLDDLQLDSLKAFYTSHFDAREMEVFACGSIDQTTHDLLVTQVGSLQLERSGATTARGAAMAKPENKEEVYVDMPESLQSSIRVGKTFPLIQHPDYLKLLVLNEILGGYFGSRLMRNIREDKGYTYGIYSTISIKEQDSLFFIGTDVNYAVTQHTIDEIKKEIKQLQDVPVPEDELAVVKNYMLGKFINELATIFEQCDRYKRIVLHNLPLDHYNSLITTVRNISSDEIQQLAKQYLPLESLQVAVAGRRSE